MMKRKSRIDSSIGLDLIKEDTFKSQLRRARRMSVATKSNQKKVVSTLVLITTMFTIVNIPSAISRIMSSSEWQEDKSFQVHRVHHGHLYRWTENSFPFFLYLKPVEISKKGFNII